MAKKLEKLGSGQLEVLRHVLERGPVTVGQVAEHFAQSKGQARTTILTVMEKLRSKGFLVRRKRNGVFQYSSVQQETDVLSGVIRQFVNETLGGSVSPFVAYLAENRDLTADELAELKMLVKQLEAEKKGES